MFPVRPYSLRLLSQVVVTPKLASSVSLSNVLRFSTTTVRRSGGSFKEQPILKQNIKATTTDGNDIAVTTVITDTTVDARDVLSPSFVAPKYSKSVQEARSKFKPEELEAARLARLAGLGWLGNLPERIIPYAELMRLEKPVGTLLLLAPCYWGITMAAYSIAAPALVTLKAIVLFSIGAIIMRGAGCTINDIWDRDLDNQVARTMERPITSGRVTVPQAVAWMGAQGLAGLAVLLCLPWECFWLGALSLPFIAAYPLFKRFTYYPQIMFSICFSWGILLGFPAVGAPLNLALAAPLFVSNCIWGVTYDTIYAHQDKKFDIKAGIKSTALAWGDNSKKIMYGLTVAQAALYTLAGVMNSMGPGFYLGAVWGFSRLFNLIKNVNLDDQRSCWSTFTGNIHTGFILWYGILFDYILQLLGFL